MANFFCIVTCTHLKHSSFSTQTVAFWTNMSNFDSSASTEAIEAELSKFDMLVL